MAGLWFLGDGKVTINMKCVVFSAIILALFYTNPPPDMRTGVGLGVTAFTLFFVSYVAMAYYDHVYQCQKGRLKYGSGLTSSAKVRPPEGTTADPKGFNSVAWGHVAFIAPLVGYAGYVGATGRPMPQWLGIALGFTAIMAALAHAPYLSSSGHAHGSP